MLVFAVFYELCRGEITAPRWSDIDTDRRTITVQSSLARVAGQLVLGPTNTHADQRSLPIVDTWRPRPSTASGPRQEKQRSSAGVEWQETGHIFTTRTGRPVEPRNPSRSFDRIVADAGLLPIVFHDVRRTTATLLKDLGLPVPIPRDVRPTRRTRSQLRSTPSPNFGPRSAEGVPSPVRARASRA